MARDILITILNRDYFIKDDIDSLLLSSYVNYVESKMKEIGETNNIVDTGKIAVLTALSICKELFEERLKLNNNNNKIDQLINDLSVVIDS